MRVTVAHNKSREEAKRAVDGAVERLLTPDGAGPVKISNVQKSWDGSTLNFSLKAGMAMFSAPIRGWIEVTDTHVTIDADLPALLSKFVSEKKIEAGVQSRVRALLT